VLSEGTKTMPRHRYTTLGPQHVQATSSTQYGARVVPVTEYVTEHAGIEFAETRPRRWKKHPMGEISQWHLPLLIHPMNGGIDATGVIRIGHGQVAVASTYSSFSFLCGGCCLYSFRPSGGVTGGIDPSTRHGTPQGTRSSSETSSLSERWCHLN
jgi:hypothetical protein